MGVGVCSSNEDGTLHSRSMSNCSRNAIDCTTSEPENHRQDGPASLILMVNEWQRRAGGIFASATRAYGWRRASEIRRFAIPGISCHAPSRVLGNLSSSLPEHRPLVNRGCASWLV